MRGLRWINYLSVFVSFSVKKALIEPKRFFLLVSQRFMGYQVIGTVKAWTEAVEGRNREEDTPSRRERLDFFLYVGDYDRALAEFKKMPLIKRCINFPKKILAKIKENQFYGAIYKGREATGLGGSTNILYYVNNSLPYTQSGYTIRTAALTKTVREKVDSISTVTRLGYPLIIGKIPSPAKEPSGLNTLIPRVMPFREDRRYRLAKKLLMRVCAERGIDLIQTTSDFKNASLVSDVAHDLGIPWIYEIRGEPHNTWLSKFPVKIATEAEKSFHYRHSEQKEIEAAVKASAVIVLSELTKNKLVRAGISEDKIVTIPNAIDSGMQIDRKDALNIRTQMGLRGKKVVGTVSSLVSYEGLDTLIRALPNLDERIEVVFVGDGEDRGRLAALAASLGVGSRVHFVGRQPSSEIQSWYSIFDVFVVPRIDSRVTRYVTPIKPLNALAVGVPLVCSDLPALRAVTGGYAKFVPPQSPTDLARAITEVIESPEKRLAEKEWLNSMTWEANGRKLARLYRSLLN